MIAEALAALSDLVKKTVEPAYIIASDPRTERVVVNGQVLEYPTPIEERAHGVDALEDVIALANRFAEGEHKPVVWVDENAVHLVIDDECLRIDTAAIRLKKSDVFSLLERLRANPAAAWMEQKPFVRTLKVELADAGDDVSRLLETVRKVTFEQGSVVSGKVGRGDESLGREIAAKLDVAGSLADELVVQAPVYKTAGERDRYGIRCSLDVDPQLCKFQLLPIPDELERVVQMHLASIRQRLEFGLSRVEVPIYFGRP